MKFDIKVPASLREIKLSQWQKYTDILKKNEGEDKVDFVNMKALEIFCNVNLKQIHDIPLKTFDGILQHLGHLLNEKPKRSNMFTLRGTDNKEVTFGMIPNLDKMSYGEFEDLNAYLFDEKNLHKAMAVLYRPLMWSKGDRYLIHPYKGTDEMAEVMKDTPLDVVFGARVFFYNLAKKLGIYTLDYTLQQLMTQEENHLDNPSEKSGVHTKQFILSQMEMLKRLTELQNFHSTNA